MSDEIVKDRQQDGTSRLAETGVHRIVVEIVSGAAFWFIAVTWFNFARGGEVDWTSLS
jgi:hypothetical protein